MNAKTKMTEWNQKMVLWDTESYRTGFSDRTDNKENPEHPQDEEYMRGWRTACGMEDGYNAIPPVFPSDSDYWEGYQDAAHERWCHLSCCWKNTPCDRFIKTTKCECTEGL